MNELEFEPVRGFEPTLPQGGVSTLAPDANLDMLNNGEGSSPHFEANPFESSATASALKLENSVNLGSSSAVNAGPSRTDQLHEISLLLHRPSEDTSENIGRRHLTENNNRRFSRCPISEEGSAAVLNVNGRRIECRLVELSIGGFGVVVGRQLQLYTGTVGSLRAPGFNYIVSVTRLEGRADGLFIGLRQLEEVIDPQQHLPGEASPVASYLIAGVAGILIAAVSYFFIYGH